MKGEDYKKSVGIYCRLSNEDGENLLSNSIENQMNMLKKYADENYWHVYDYYIDDGYTGTNFDRPEFKRMIEDIKRGNISIVMTKDMSRLGRDYIQVGFYIEKFFPESGIRYIALNDGVDTKEEGINDDITPFKAIMNDYYSKDISKKIRSVLDLKRKEGKFIGSFAPYGYEKNPNHKGHLMIDEEASWVVEKIFDLYLSGKGLKAICIWLNDSKIPCPSVYKSKKIKNYNPVLMKSSKWCHSTIKNILTNKTYTGDLTQGKSKKINYKSKKIKRLKEEDWLSIKNTHDPIVSKETFEMVRNLMNQKSKKYKGAKKSVKSFSGLAFCGDCGGYMTYYKMPKGYYFLICSTYKKYGKKECTRHSILEKKLEEMVIKDVKDLVNKFVDLDKFQKELQKIVYHQKQRKSVEKELATIEKRLAESTHILKSLYEDKVKKNISEEEFFYLYKEFQCDKENLLIRKNFLYEKNNYKPCHKNKIDMEKTISKLWSKYEFRRLIFTQLIDQIEVFEENDIIIHYKIRH
ncbi:recombinase family protein [Inediibacterium massiliense]|uniref:recombinase family protein n=1 Tax=Inediibacterium massiliense TaxID=1658111 RepID=UPI0006B65169|nr:recombinase family protein [Inediibacterium massiliense]